MCREISHTSLHADALHAKAEPVHRARKSRESLTERHIDEARIAQLDAQGLAGIRHGFVADILAGAVVDLRAGVLVGIEKNQESAASSELPTDDARLEGNASLPAGHEQLTARGVVRIARSLQ